MTRSNARRYHLLSGYFVRTVCGKRDGSPSCALTVDLYIWKTLPREAQCTRCRKFSGHCWATDEQIIAVETALHGIAKVFNTG